MGHRLHRCSVSAMPTRYLHIDAGRTGVARNQRDGAVRSVARIAPHGAHFKPAAIDDRFAVTCGHRLAGSSTRQVAPALEARDTIGAVRERPYRLPAAAPPEHYLVAWANLRKRRFVRGACVRVFLGAVVVAVIKMPPSGVVPLGQRLGTNPPDGVGRGLWQSPPWCAMSRGLGGWGA